MYEKLCGLFLLRSGADVAFEDGEGDEPSNVGVPVNVGDRLDLEVS